MGQSPAVVKKRYPIMVIDFGIGKCESGFAYSIVSVPYDGMKYARML